MLRRQSDTSSESESSTGQFPVWLFIWIGVQLVALGVGAMRVPLSARYPEPAEGMALQLMVVVQVSAGAMLFPVLMRSWGMSVMAVAVSWPFVQLGGYLSGQGWDVAVTCAVYVSVWLGLLAVWGWGLGSARWRMTGVAAAVGLSLGGALLWYLGAEFSGWENTPAGARVGALGPVVGVLAIVDEGGWLWGPWLFLLVLWVVTVLVVITARSRQFIH